MASGWWDIWGARGAGALVLDEEGARDIKSTAIIVSLSPDVCKTPVGSATPPVPYPIVAYLQDDANTSGDVFMTNKRAHNMGSLVTQVTGDEAGKAGGLKSGTVDSVCHPKTHSSSVRINGQWAVRHSDEWYMNNKNTVGKLTYIQDTNTYDPTPAAEESTEREEPVRYAQGEIAESW